MILSKMAASCDIMRSGRAIWAHFRQNKMATCFGMFCILVFGLFICLGLLMCIVCPPRKKHFEGAPLWVLDPLCV